jgi:FkbM family methyltransferase
LVKKLAAAVLCHPLMGAAIRTIFRSGVPHRGNRIETPASGDRRIDAMLFWRAYESAEIRLVQRYVGSDLDVVEMGSSIGGVSCEIARCLGDARQLICIEANPEIFPTLQRNVTRNRPGLHVHFVPGAVDYSDRSHVEMAIGETSLGSHVQGERRRGLRTVSVPAVQLARILADHAVAEYVLVADIEGAEVPLLVCDAPAFRRCRAMILELHETEFRGIRYTPSDIVELVTRQTGLRPRDRYGDVYAFVRDTPS